VGVGLGVRVGVAFLRALWWSLRWVCREVGMAVGVDVGLGFGLCFVLLWRGGFSAFAVLRGRKIGVDVGTAVHVGSGVGEGSVVLSGAMPAVGVGVSARPELTEIPLKATPRTKPARERRTSRPDMCVLITSWAAIVGQASAGCSAPNDRIRSSTSSITESGVEAPAVTPMR
jgi:hypothetical protein